MNQLSLTDQLERVEAGAPMQWLSRARKELHWLATTRDQITSDDLRDILGYDIPAEPRAIGAVFLYGKQQGWIAKTDRVVPTTYRQANCRPIAVWRSRLRGAS